MDSNDRVGRYGAKDVIEKKVGVISVVAMLYSICCAGAFGIEEMIPEGGPGMTIAMLIILPFVWAMPYCFICAELGSARPLEGGKLMWVKEALGEFWFGIMVLVHFFWGLIANTVYVVLAVSYLGSKIELTSMQAYILKVGLILIFFIVNILGIKEVGIVSTFISISVFAAFLLVTVVGFANYQQNPVVPFINPDYSGAPLMAFGAALGIGIWMYAGFDEISLVGGEIKDANRIIPKALMIVIPLMAATYVLPTLAGLASIGSWDEWTTESDGMGYHTVFGLSSVAPGALSLLFIIVAVLSQCSIFNVCIMAASRSALILSDENIGPGSLAKLSSKRGTPIIALIIIGIVTTALLGTPNNQLDFKFLALIDAFFCVIVCSLVVVSAMILKRRIPACEVPFRVPGGLIGHNIMCGCCFFFCLAFAWLNGTDYFLGGFIIVLAIPIVYIICKWVWKGMSVKEPLLYPIDKRTGLGFGDITRLGGYYLGFGLFGIISRFFLEQYEGETYTARWYEQEYGTGLFADFYAMLDAISFLGAAAAAAGVVLLLAGRKLTIGLKPL